MPPKQATRNGINIMPKIKYVSAAACVMASACLFASNSHAKKVANVVIEKTGQTRDPQYAEQCAKFRPTAAQVKRFFSKAVPVTKRVVQHDWYSSCFAKGTVAFIDGWVWG
jgi:hypothetical protein